MKVLILGANGRVGSLVAAQLVANGHEVLAGIHKKSDRIPAGVTTVTLDILNQSLLEQQLEGVDAVVCALSSWASAKRDVLSTTMHTLIPAMEKDGVGRIVSISGDVARIPGERPSLPIRLFHTIALGPIRAIISDSEDHLRQLHASNLDWTVIRPGIMTASHNPRHVFKDTHPLGLFIPRAAVVASIVDLIESSTHIREAPFISTR